MVTPASFSSLGTLWLGFSSLANPFVLIRVGIEGYSCFSVFVISMIVSSLSVGSPNPQKMISFHFREYLAVWSSVKMSWMGGSSGSFRLNWLIPFLWFRMQK